MPVVKLRSGSFQAKILGPDGNTVSKTFLIRKEASQQLAQWKLDKKQKRLQPKTSLPSLDEYFLRWYTDVSQETREEEQSGWRKAQLRIYRQYIQPILGNERLDEIGPDLVKRVINQVAQLGRAPQTQRHVYQIMRKMFGDSIEIYQYLTFNPVLRKFNPDVPVLEAKRLNLEQIKALLRHVEGKKYGLAIWVQLYLGLRCGELRALRWEDVDLGDRRIVIRRAFVKHTGKFREYPKGRKQHSHSLPLELWQRLSEARKTAVSDYVVPSPDGPQYILPHRWYLKALKDYCRELEIPVIGTHGLRHSTSEIYLSHGASRDDMRQLFAHSSLTVTDRYIRDRASNLERVSNVIRLFPADGGANEESKSSMKTSTANISKEVSTSN